MYVFACIQTHMGLLQVLSMLVTLATTAVCLLDHLFQAELLQRTKYLLHLPGSVCSALLKAFVVVKCSAWLLLVHIHWLVFCTAFNFCTVAGTPDHLCCRYHLLLLSRAGGQALGESGMPECEELPWTCLLSSSSLGMG